MSKILVTGASGYIAIHAVDQLLRAGHQVRGTVRSLKDSKKTEPIYKLADNAAHPLELVEADLLDADSWHKAVEGIEIVLHMASPVTMNPDVPDEEIINPAVDGTLNVLRAAQKAGVKRVVVTSSGITVVGVGYADRLYSEDDWADVIYWTKPTKIPHAYGKSKVMAERAAWNFVEEKKKAGEQCFELATILPMLVLGPVLSNVVASTTGIFLDVFHARKPQIANRSYPTCDVRDVAQAHIKAAFFPEAVGHRHLVSSTAWVPIKEWAAILRNEYNPKGYKIPEEVEDGAPHLPATTISDSRMRNVLGITPYTLSDTILDMAKSAIEHGIN